MKIKKKYIWIISIVVFLGFAIHVLPNIIIYKVVNPQIEKLLGTKLFIEDIDINFYKGSVLIKNLKIDNLKGYDQKHIFLMERLFVDVDLLSILSSEIVIEEITLTNYQTNVDFKNVIDVNISELMDNIEKNSPKKEEDSEDYVEEEKSNQEEAENEKAKKKLRIKNISITDGKIAFSGAVMPIPDIEIDDLENVSSFLEVVVFVFDTILTSTLNVITDNGIVDATADTVKNIPKGVINTTKKIIINPIKKLTL